MLAASGRLVRVPPPAAARDLKVIEMKNDGPEAARLEKEGRASRHRSLYLPLLRCLVPQALEVFDFAGQGMVTGRRDTTTVAPQALFLLNDPFVREQASALAGRLAVQLETGDRIRSAYRQILCREATPKEVERAEAYLPKFREAAGESKEAETLAWASFCQALLGSAEFRYVR
jgi:hypothetical protein